MRLLLSALLMLAGTGPAFAADDFEKDARWITGDVFTEKDVLLFRTDKPVKDNPAGNVVLLGATKDGMKVLLPAYVKAADKQMKLRLYGVLMPANKTISAKLSIKPAVQFITWKIHLPSDPDETPAGEKIIIGPNDTVPGSKVEIKKK